MTSPEHPVAKELTSRYALLEGALKRLQELNFKNVQRLAATDVFIEKAQHRLTLRAIQFFLAGGLLAVFTLSLLVAGAYLVLSHSLETDLKQVGALDGYKLALLILRGTTVTTFILAAAFVCFSFAKAFFHEGTNSLNRRHALRFGRLYVYLRDGNIVFKDMERAFNWNIENTTAFKDIKTENVMKTVAGKAIEQPAEAIRAARGKRPGGERDA